VFIVSGVITANGMLVGDGKEESDVILVGKVLSFVENKTSLETNYLVEVEKYLKTPKNYDTNTKTITVVSPGLRQYDDPQQMMIYDKIFNIDDRVLFLLYQKDGILVESLYSQTTKSNCSPKQLLDEMYGESGLHISQNNQSRHFYTNQPIDLTYYGYNRDLMAEKKDFEFKVNVPKTGQILSEKTQLDFQECKRTASASWSFTPTVAGKYAFHSIIGNNEGGSESFSGFLIEYYIDSPLKQFKSGISVDKIRCKDEYIIIQRHDGSPVCVSYHTGEKLLQRGAGICPDMVVGRDHPCGPHSSPAMKYKSPFVADKNGKVTLDGKDALDICAAMRLPCPTNPTFSGNMLDENNVLVKISGTSDFDVKLNQTHVCVTSKAETTCEMR
jgi:hypothetical protein